MAKIDSILSLINLLSNREHVSLKNIMSSLGISRRTAFRYLNTISEANFPLLHDRSKGGYQITSVRKNYVPPLDLTDSILIMASLMVMKKRLGGEYARMISIIESRFLSCLSVPLEEVLTTYKHEFQVDDDHENTSKLITSLLIEVAITYGKGIKMLRTTEPAAMSESVVENPSLWFKGEWRIADRESDSDDNTLLNTIERVRIL